MKIRHRWADIVACVLMSSATLALVVVIERIPA